MSELIASSPDEADALLRRTFGSPGPAVGAVTLRRADGEEAPFRVSGRLVQPASDDAPAIAGLSFRRRYRRSHSGERDRQLKAIEDARQNAEQAVRRERDFSDAAIRSLPGVF